MRSRRSRRGRGTLAALAGVLTVFPSACAGDVIGEFPSPPTPVITASATPELDEGFLAEIPVEGSPCFLAEAGGRVWVTAFDGNELIEIDPATNEVVATYSMPEGPCGMVVHDGRLWIESPNVGAVVVFDPDRARIVERLRFPGGLFGLTETSSGLWGVADESEEVVQIDPRTHRIVGRVAIEPPLAGLASDGRELWTISGQDELVRIDPATHSIAERFRLERFEPQALAIAGDTFWVSSSFEGEVLRVDRRTGRVRDRLPVDGSLFGGIVIGDSYWVSSNDGSVYRLDASSGEVVEQLEQVGFGPIPAAGNLWTLDFVSNTIYRLDAGVT